MKKNLVKDVVNTPDDFFGKEVFFCGWIRNIHSLKNVIFFELFDGSMLNGIQVVCEEESCFSIAKKLKRGMSIKVKGIFMPSKGGKEEWELKATDILVEGNIRNINSENKKGINLDTLRKQPHLRVRTKLFYSVFKIRSLLTMATHQFFQERDFINVVTPTITSSSFEGAGDIFSVNKSESKDLYFGKPAYLAVSGQLYDEALMYGFGKVYSFGPTYRANDSNTIRHLSEFWMIEPEMAFSYLEDGIE